MSREPAFSAEVSPWWRRLWRRPLESIEDSWEAWTRAQGGEGLAGEPRVHFLLSMIRTSRDELRSLDEAQRLFVDRLTRILSAGAREQLILDRASDFHRHRRDRKADQRAIARDLDAEALEDRHRQACGELQLRLLVLLDRLGAVGQTTLEAERDRRSSWERFGFLGVLAPILEVAEDDRIVAAALAALRDLLVCLPEADRAGALGEKAEIRIHRLAQATARSTRVQVHALQILAAVSAESFTKIAQRCFETATGDGIFVRTFLVRLIDAELLSLAVKDGSPLVRQAAGDRLDLDLLDDLLVDPVAAVRGSALLSLLRFCDRSSAAQRLKERLSSETDDWVLRVACHVATTWPESGRSVRFEPELEELAAESASLTVRRHARRALATLRVQSSEPQRRLLETLEPIVATIRPGRSARVPAETFSELDAHAIGRVLAVLAQDDHPLHLEPGRRAWTLGRGWRFRFRLWRALHEIRHPAPDKRQAHRHTIGRVDYGTIRAPSGVLAELAETRVPGEPLMISEEGGWRPYIPLLDDILSVLNQIGRPRAHHFHTPEGVTVVRPPRSHLRRTWAWLTLQTRFAAFAQARNWTVRSSRPPSGFVDSISALGFEIEHLPEGRPDPSVDRFFSRAVPPVMINLFGQFWDYSLTLYENSLRDLVIFLAAAGAFFLGRHAWLNRQLVRARSRLPVVIGGWGTRGKSSVERLKAGLFASLGLSVFSKTTGCEAMFLHCSPFGKLREMFLYRPYDKATIWEQGAVVQLADQLNADVFLWECMGLNPSYVEILQRRWMRDDLATITNTYPDHEDVQGPSGYDIPVVMTRFIPRGSRLINSEEQMRPILAEAARELGTTMTSVGWLEAGLLTDDVLERFPYEEHPYNLALVVAMGEEMGIDRLTTLEATADHVVPDIGVLKTFPPAPVESRRLEFSNGCSANERHGALSNWQRLDFDTAPAPGVQVTTVVNNRADRIPRSQVFARILANDFSADRHVLIGGNLAGLVRYIEEAWDERMSTFVPSAAANRELAKFLRIPVDETALQACLAAMLPEDSRAALAPALARGDDEDVRAIAHGDEIVAHAERLRSQVRSFLDVLDSTDADEVLRVSRQLFLTKIRVVAEYDATGDEIVDAIVSVTPPHFRNRIMGLQNIKGTGLDFVYRWQDWETLHSACSDLSHLDRRRAQRGLQVLLGFAGHGRLTAEHLARTLEEVRLSAFSQVERNRSALLLVEEKSKGPRSGPSRSIQARSPIHRWALSRLESFLDAGDSVRRRQAADAIYADLVTRRVGVGKAVTRLRELVKRQKGGWLGRS